MQRHSADRKMYPLKMWKCCIQYSLVHKFIFGGCSLLLVPLQCVRVFVVSYVTRSVHVQQYRMPKRRQISVVGYTCVVLFRSVYAAATCSIKYILHTMLMRRSRTACSFVRLFIDFASLTTPILFFVLMPPPLPRSSRTAAEQKESHRVSSNHQRVIKKSTHRSCGMNRRRTLD